MGEQNPNTPPAPNTPPTSAEQREVNNSDWAGQSGRTLANNINTGFRAALQGANQAWNAVSSLARGSGTTTYDVQAFQIQQARNAANQRVFEEMAARPTLIAEETSPVQAGRTTAPGRSATGVDKLSDRPVPLPGSVSPAVKQAALDRANAAVANFDELVKQSEANPELQNDPAFLKKLEDASAEMKSAREELENIKAAEAGADASAEQRDIQCPNCNGSFLIVYAGRLFSSLCGWLQKTFNIRIDIIETFKSYIIERLPQSKRVAFQGGCPYCGGKGTVKDPSDIRAKQAQAASIAQSKAAEIQELEAKLGTGGNEYKIMSGHCVHEIGIGINDSPSYTVLYDQGYRLKGMADYGKGGMNPKFGPLPEGGKKNHVQGINPIASPGGQYTIKCSNKFSVLAGALGVEITTGGPVTIKGGITRITGPEITIGTQTGTLTLEGEVVNIIGKSVELGPKNGQQIVKGSGGYTGNLTVKGHMHAETASAVKLYTVGRNEASKVSSSNNLISGPAFWGGTGSTKGLKVALKELIAYVLSHVTNPELAKHIVSKRYIDGLLDNAANIAYMSLPEEPVQTGYALVGGVKCPVYNYPHVHANFDQPHYHETRIPDIDCTAENSEQLRAPLVGLKEGAPLHRRSTSLADVAKAIWGPIFTPIWFSVWEPFTQLIRGFFGGEQR